MDRGACNKPLSPRYYPCSHEGITINGARHDHHYRTAYVRIGSVEAFIERVSPRKRRAWFSIERDTSLADDARQGTLLGFAWWDLQINRVIA